ncbi:hypothetical protein J6590_007572 [Homalodisca vitripennis]|nr:hypothetical protein J6590_007572 [Homalodisca vitripennis]
MAKDSTKIDETREDKPPPIFDLHGLSVASRRIVIVINTEKRIDTIVLLQVEREMVQARWHGAHYLPLPELEKAPPGSHLLTTFLMNAMCGKMVDCKGKGDYITQFFQGVLRLKKTDLDRESD